MDHDARTADGTGAADTELDPLDRIDRSIDIDASAERVWDLVSRPGWWINEGAVDPDPDLRREGDVTLMTHPTFGAFRLRTVASTPLSHVAFPWLEQDAPDTDGPATLVEFWIEPRDGGVTLRVAESGFSQLSKEREAWLSHRADNVEGWESELGAARTYAEKAAAA